MRKFNPKRKSFDSDPNIIALKQFLRKNKWTPSQDLRLRDFPCTGRGLCSRYKVLEGATLIEIPYELMITLTTIQNSEIMHLVAFQTLKINELLAMFLALEKHKDAESLWSWYLNTLPDSADIPNLPWLCQEHYLDLLPEDIKSYVIKYREAFERSWKKINLNLNELWSCTCCKSNPKKVFTKDLYLWAFLMVNTRSVYVDPIIVLNNQSNKIQGEPDMAMCPFLDMFNHSDLALTSAGLEKLSNGNYSFKLITNKSYKAHEQIFISYGQRSNLTLLCDYGFFTRCIFNEEINIPYQELIAAQNFLVNSTQREFIHKHDLKHSLKVTAEGLSFNLKGLLYVLFSADKVYKWSNVIFNDSYDCRTLFLMYELIHKILVKKFNNFSIKYNNVRNNFSGNCKSFEQILDYMKFRVEFFECVVGVCLDEMKRINFKIS